MVIIVPAYLSTWLAAAELPQKAKSQGRYARFFGEGGQRRRHQGQQQRKWRSGAITMGRVCQERCQGQEAGKKVGTSDYTGHSLTVNGMDRKQETRDRVREIAPSWQDLWSVIADIS